MSDIMRPIPFAQMMDWILTEHANLGSVFGVRKIVRHEGGADPIFNEKIELPFGPAAGPNSQLAQNIVASYVAGSRFFEVKTVQVMDGAELSACVNKPCIVAEDECYNCEWSTELEVGQALNEYVKAWWACKLLSRELGLGAADGFVFNMSVGYDLEGIKSAKVDNYIESMKDASNTAVWAECRDWALANLDRFEHVDAEFVNSVSPHVSTSVTESTLHGCPPAEIERIATYLICEKGLNTYIKCNPTLLGYDYARARLNELGFDYIAFDDKHFVEDLQWEDSRPDDAPPHRPRREPRPRLWREAHEHVPRRCHALGAAERGDVHVRPLAVPAYGRGGTPHLSRVRRQAAHQLLRRRRRPQHP